MREEIKEKILMKERLTLANKTKNPRAACVINLTKLGIVDAEMEDIARLIVEEETKAHNAPDTLMNGEEKDLYTTKDAFIKDIWLDENRICDAGAVVFARILGDLPYPLLSRMEGLLVQSNVGIQEEGTRALLIMRRKLGFQDLGLCGTGNSDASAVYDMEQQVNAKYDERETPTNKHHGVGCHTLCHIS